MTLTDRETDLMEVLWERGPSTVAEVHAGLRVELAYTTVLSLMRTLESKGLVNRTKEGRAHRYSPAIERDEARGHALSDLATRLFRGSTELLLVHLVSNEALSAEAIGRIRQLLSKRAKGKT